MLPKIALLALMVLFTIGTACSSENAKPDKKPTTKPKVAVKKQPPKAQEVKKTYKDAPCGNEDWARLPPGAKPQEGEPSPK